MSDLISRQTAIELIERMKSYNQDADDIAEMIANMPSAQPQSTMGQVNDTAQSTNDCISRRAAIDAPVKMVSEGIEWIPVYHLKDLPSAQPEIIRCGQCKYAEVADKEDTQDGYTCQFHRWSIWFSGSYCSWAERRTDGRPYKQTSGD